MEDLSGSWTVVRRCDWRVQVPGGIPPPDRAAGNCSKGS